MKKMDTWLDIKRYVREARAARPRASEIEVIARIERTGDTFLKITRIA